MLTSMSTVNLRYFTIIRGDSGWIYVKESWKIVIIWAQLRSRVDKHRLDVGNHRVERRRAVFSKEFFRRPWESFFRHSNSIGTQVPKRRLKKAWKNHGCTLQRTVRPYPTKPEVRKIIEKDMDSFPFEGDIVLLCSWYQFTCQCGFACVNLSTPFRTSKNRRNFACRFSDGCFAGMFEGSFPETNSSHLKMDGWNTNFLLGWPIFRGELLVSGRVPILLGGIKLDASLWSFLRDFPRKRVQNE